VAEDPSSKSFVRSVDCLVCVGLKAVRFADMSFAISRARTSETDGRILVTRIVNIGCDERQQIVGQPTVDMLFDLRAGVSGVVDVFADSQIAAWGEHTCFFDVGVATTAHIGAEFDVTVRVTEARAYQGRADTSVVVVHPVDLNAASSLLIFGQSERLADVGIVSVRSFQRDLDARLQILENHGVDSRSDIRLVITAGSIVPKDIALEADLLVSLYVFLIRQTHLIQV
jgi:hypothetical protein